METIETLNSTFLSSGGGAEDDASTALTTSESSKLAPFGSDLICMLRMKSFSQISCLITDSDASETNRVHSMRFHLLTPLGERLLRLDLGRRLLPLQQGGQQG